ncbi:MAG: hypothetical protein IJO90_06015 [Alistipes sp.]|nr:hypothetical protein [Alistipes sp.]MBQ9962908.1 hypothetical protein [Alistipes sp.]
MTGKDVVLRINAITNTDEVEALGKVLDSVLGTYEDNVQLLAQYNQQLNETSANIKALNKAQQEQGGLSAKQQARYAELIKQERELKQGKSELQIVMKNQEKIMQSENGSMKQQSLILGQLRMLWRNLTDEQKAALPQLKTAIDGLDSSLKKADADIGNFQRNVGNYPQLLQQVLPVQSQFGNSLMQLAQSAGLSTGALGTLGAALGVGALAYKGFQQAMDLTQTVGDEVAIKVAGWEAVWDKFIRTIVSADFSNFLQGLRDAKDVAEETAAALDELFERNNALAIAEAKASVEQQRNLKIMRDQTRSIEERKAAGEAYTASVMELAQKRQDIAKQEHEALLANFAAQTGASKEQISWYIENYDKYRDVANKYNADVAAAEEAYKAQQKYIRQLDGAATSQDYADAQALYKKWQAAKDGVSNLSEEEQKFLAVQNKYNLANDKMTTQLVNSWASVYRAIAGAEQATQRAATTVNSLTAQQDKQKQKTATKAARTQSQEDIYKQYVYDTNKEMRQQVVNAMDDIAVAMEEEVPKLIQVAMPEVSVAPEDNLSPFAKFLGVSEEQLTTIKSQALSAAQQIYGSIEQISKEATQRRLDDELQAIEDKTESEKAVLKAKFDKGILNEKQYEKKIAEIDEAAEARREEAKKEAFEKDKRLSIISALINGAVAITKVFGSTPPPASFILASLTAATTAAQVATIAAQKYARGGELHGASHAQGGIKGNIQGHNIELEGGEIVINKRSSAKYRKALSLINSENGWGVDFANTRGGGYKFARGGVLGSYNFSPAPVPQQESIKQAIAVSNERTEAMIAATNRRIDRLQVQVNISDIESVSETKQVHISRASLP